MVEKKNTLKKRIFKLAAVLVAFMCWLAPFYAIHIGVDYSEYETTGLLVIGLLIFLFALVEENLSYAFTLLCFLPFVLAHSFTNLNTPTMIFVAGGIAYAGLFLHAFIYKGKFDKGALGLGLLAFCVSMPLGGIFNHDNQYWLLQIGICCLFAFLILSVYFFAMFNRVKPNFDELADIVNGLGLLIVLEFIAYLIMNPMALTDRHIATGCIGWGNSPNNVAMILLLTMPFSFYRFCYGKRKFDFLYFVLTCVELGVIFITYSKGGSLIGVAGFLIMLIIGAIHLRKNCWKLFLILLIAMDIVVVYLYRNPDVYGYLMRYLPTQLNFNSLKSRLEIYKTYWDMGKKQPVFGYGLLYPLVYIVEIYDGTTYQWGHDTFLHSFYCLGIFGLLCLLFHMVEKYYGVFRKMDRYKFVLLLTFALSGLYGLIDVSYFFINYMIALLIIFCFADPYLARIPYRNPFKKKQKQE